jgi:hypothetical protein
MRTFVVGAGAAIVVVALVLVVLRRRRGEPLRRSQALAIAAGVVYGVLGRLAFGLSYSKWNPDVPIWVTQSLAVMSVSFLFFMPLTIGFLDQVVPERAVAKARHPWLRAFFSPMVPVLLMLALIAVFEVEGTICIAMALPIFLLLAGIGGCIGLAVRRNTEGKTRAGMISFVVLLPYLASPAEQQLRTPVEIREVTNTVRIAASPEVVWREIKSVPAISPDELPFRFAHFIGLPRPIEATLSDDRTGGVRIARFERGLRFREIVSAWEPERRLSFSIRAEPAPPTALDEHVAVGGPYFDVLDGTYELQAGHDGTTVLKLTSHQRLSTRFNFYAGLWTDLIMSDLQSAITAVIERRCVRDAVH